MNQYIVNIENMEKVLQEVIAYVGENVDKKPMIIEARPYDKKIHTSHQQMKYLHCDNGPIKLFSEYQGSSVHEAELFLKRECGEHLFVRPLGMSTMDSLAGKIGKAYWECTNSACRKLAELQLIAKNKRCLNCNSDKHRLIMILSKTELTTKQTNEWIESMYSFLSSSDIDVRVQMPDADWNK